MGWNAPWNSAERGGKLGPILDLNSPNLAETQRHETDWRFSEITEKHDSMIRRDTACYCVFSFHAQVPKCLHNICGDGWPPLPIKSER